MTLRDQHRWLRNERRRCEHLLAETMVIGRTVLDKARVDLAAVIALQASLEHLTALASPALFEKEML